MGLDVFSASSLVSVGHMSKRKRAIDTVRLLRSFASQLTLRFLGGVGTYLEGVGSGVPMAGLNLVWQKGPKFFFLFFLGLRFSLFLFVVVVVLLCCCFYVC